MQYKFIESILTNANNIVIDEVIKYCDQARLYLLLPFIYFIFVIHYFNFLRMAIY